MKRFSTTLLLYILTFIIANAQRTVIPLNEDWRFSMAYHVQHGMAQRVDLPHTWNAADALVGKVDYMRGLGKYEKRWFVPKEWKGERAFVRCKGANTVADVEMNGQYVGEHKGGYTAFAFELTPFLKYGEENTLSIKVSNAHRMDVMPLVGDFNMYGGLYRGVELWRMDKVCFSPLDHGQKGVEWSNEKVDRKHAEGTVALRLSNGDTLKHDMKVRVTLYEKNKRVWGKEKRIAVEAACDTVVVMPWKINNPHLWEGIKDPFRYRVVAQLVENHKVVDEVALRTGMKWVEIDANKGLFLNGHHLQLHGVCRHQDRAEIGNALREMHHEEDADILMEMGVNAIRLAHYPQAEEMYDLMDSLGILVWAEIPFVGPGGYVDEGFVDKPEFKDNGKEQLLEMIRQNRHHPSIFVWGLFNELSMRGASPIPYIKELNRLAHEEDPTRWTVAASNIDAPLNGITDLIAWNKYYGWYGGQPSDMEVWLRRQHKEQPTWKIGVSEYGAGGSIYHQQGEVKKPKANGWWHPENYQTHYHMESWKAIDRCPFVWGSFVWNMFDFGAAHRREGDRQGINDKGLVTFDRKVRKDAFYFYQANWNAKAKVLHLCGKRYKERKERQQTFMVFTNLGACRLTIDGEDCGMRVPDEYGVCIWKDVQLPVGHHEIVVENKKMGVRDSAECDVREIK